MAEPKQKPNRVRLNTYVDQSTFDKVKKMNADGVARSDGAVVDLAVSDLDKKVAKAKKKGKG